MPAYSTYDGLTSMLAAGWQIEPPVYVRPRWRSRVRPESERENTYHFVLRHGESYSLVSVFDCPEVRRLLTDNRLVVDRL